MERLNTTLGNIRMNTPLIAVSGIYGINYESLIQSRRYLGAVITKSVTLSARAGNPEPRIVPTRAGLLNSIGLSNPGIKVFIEQEIPKLRSLEVPVIASVAGSDISEYIQCSSLLATRDEIDAIELNVSCPNVKAGGIEFGCDANILEQLIRGVRKVTGTKLLIAKLTPNVTDIAGIAQAAINGGADVISLINTLRGMAIDLNTKKPTLGNKVGGLSGIGIHPVAVYMVYQCYTSCCKSANIPIIGIGGVTNHDEALELLLAGAACVGIGTALFRSLTVFKDVAEGINKYLEERGLESIKRIVGKSADYEILSFSDIAKFLNIPEAKVRSLCDQKILPGHPDHEGWISTEEEINKWYLCLSSRQWADLVEDGNLEAISAEINLGANISVEKLKRILKNWQDTRTAEVLGQRFGSKGSIIFYLKFLENQQINTQHLQDITKQLNQVGSTTELGQILISMRKNVSAVLEDHLFLNTQSILLSLNQNGLLRLYTEEILENLPQRDREIIRFFFISYIERLAHQIQQV